MRQRAPSPGRSPCTTLFRSDSALGASTDPKNAAATTLSVTVPLGKNGGSAYNTIPVRQAEVGVRRGQASSRKTDRKSTRLNSSHLGSSSAVFCLKKTKKMLQ